MSKTNHIFKILCLLLVFATVSGSLMMFASCKKEEKPGENQTTETVERESADPGSEEERYRPEDVDLDGYEYKLLVTTNLMGQSTYIYESEDTPREVCDYALYCRQNLMEEKHGVIMGIINEGNNAYTALTKAVLNNVADYCQGAALDATVWAVAAANGYLVDLRTLNELNLEASYWDQRIQKEFDVNGHLFALEGEYSYIDDLSTYVVIYNDTAYYTYDYYEKYGSPYQLASQGKWTYEMMMTMIKDTSHEVRVDGEMDENDFWGFVSESIVPYYFFLGSGQKYVVNSSEGLSFVAQEDTAWETNYNILEELMTLCTNEDVIIINRDAVDTGDVWTAASDIFSTNRALFRSTSLSATLRLLNMEDDYGIMPIPNYTKGQAEYYCWTNGRPFVIPTCVTDLQKASLAIEMISYYSLYDGGDSLNYAFYDLLAFARLCRSPDDVNMLKLVFANKTYDIDYAAGLTNLRNTIHNMALKDEYSALYSSISGLKDSADISIQNFVIQVESNLKKN